MLVNASCTIYHRARDTTGHDTWTRMYVPECWWFESTKSSVTTEGLKTGDIVTVRIFDLSVQIQKGDYLVRNNCPVNMQTVKDLADYDHFKVIKANYNDFGDNPHIKVVGV